MHPVRRTVRRLAVLLLAPLVTVAVGSSVAAAHTGTTARAVADGRTDIQWSFAHGCSGKPTIGLRVKLPEGAWNVSPTNGAGWTSTVTTTEIHWTGGSIPDGTTATFSAAMVLAQPTGSTVIMPTVQECTDGAEIAWIESPSSADGTESTHPAPTIVVPANATQPPSTTTSTTIAAPTTTARMAANSSAVTQEGSPSNSSGLWVFIGVCAVILGGTAILFLRHRRRSTR